MVYLSLSVIVDSNIDRKSSCNSRLFQYLCKFPRLDKHKRELRDTTKMESIQERQENYPIADNPQYNASLLFYRSR